MSGDKRLNYNQKIQFLQSSTVTQHEANINRSEAMLDPEDYEPSMMKAYLDFLKEEIEQNPSKLVKPDPVQEKEVDELLEGVE